MKSHNHAPASEELDKVAVEFTFTPRNTKAKSSPAAPAPASTSPGPAPSSSPDINPGSLPRVTRLMALAIKFDAMLARGEVKDFADLARLGYVSRARITQIMNLLTLAPYIQEAVLDSPLHQHGQVNKIKFRQVQGLGPLHALAVYSSGPVPIVFEFLVPDHKQGREGQRGQRQDRPPARRNAIHHTPISPLYQINLGNYCAE